MPNRLSSFRRLGAPLLFFLLACLLLWRIVFAGQVFVPAHFLYHLAPWSQSRLPEDRPIWNPLMYDAVGQFYPWRKFAAESMRSGSIPLWNPYQFSGTPFVANSQSAVLYPGSLLFYLMDPARAAGWSVILHLTLAASFMLLFLQALGVSRMAGVFGGIAYALSTWQISWLHLPTFLATSCWLPLALYATLRLFAPGSDQPLIRALTAVGLGFTLGMAMLAGHLQIAFYVLLATGLLALYLTAARLREREVSAAIGAWIGLVGAVALAGMLAAPQVLPSLELSRQSHRAGPVTAQGYAAYTAYAISLPSLVTLFLPDFYGNPSVAGATYFGTSRGNMYFNYAENALYIGLPTLLFAAFALLRRRQPGRMIPFLGGLALLSLLLALGTAVCALLYYYVPGFGQSGSPGRALVLWAFSLAALGALGYEKLTRDSAAPARTALVAITLPLIGGVFVAMLGQADLQHAERTMTNFSWRPQIPRQTGLFALSGLIMMAMAVGKMRTGWMAALPIGLLALDLFANGVNFNPTARREEVYPSTASIAFLRERAGHDRIMPVHVRNWSFFGPEAALPPNGAMALGLRDVQGYDSLFPGQYKAFMNRIAGEGKDASPPEVGNMVFARDPSSPLVPLAGVRYLVSPSPLSLPHARETVLDSLYLYELIGAPGRAQMADGASGSVAWREDSPTRVTLRVTADASGKLILADQFYPGWHAAVDGRPVPIERVNGIFRQVPIPAGESVVAFIYRPVSFQVGLYLMLAALSVGAFSVTLRLTARRRPASAVSTPPLTSASREE
jgi:hypothetical protein